MKWTPLALVAAGSLTLSACWSHSFPDSNKFVEVETTRQSTATPTIKVFTDANGTFYPSGWQGHMDKKKRWKAHSLLNEAVDQPDFRALIESDEDRQLEEVAAFAADKTRLFIFVHGYNNDHGEALGAYQDIEKLLDFRAGDGIIRFYWDGLQASGVGPSKIWFNAAGYSQMAGSRGLRRVLNQFERKEVFMLGHSRGTSVMLSALANPVYDPGFLADTKKVVESWGGYTPDDFVHPASLKNNGNAFHMLVLAPAVDRIDFCDASQQPTTSGRYTCDKLRDLGPQLKSLRYSVNQEDPVLRKFVGLSGSFNPTGLGTVPSVGRDLETHYDVMQAYPFEVDRKFHMWTSYIPTPAFEAMLRDAGIYRE